MENSSSIMDDDFMQTALKFRDQELLDTLKAREDQEAGVGKIQAKTIDKKKEQQREFLSQNILIVIQDANKKIIPECEFFITRRYFLDIKNLAYLDNLIQKSPRPDVEVDFFIDNEGTALWLEDMLIKAQPPPTYYIIIPKVRRKPEDIRQNPCYSGETVILIKDVPNHAHDNITVVDETVLNEWFIFAIIEEDPKLRYLKDR